MIVPMVDVGRRCLREPHVGSISIEYVPAATACGFHGQLGSVRMNSNVIGTKFQAGHFEQRILGTDALNVMLENAVFHAHPPRAPKGKSNFSLLETAGFHEVGGFIPQREEADGVVLENTIQPADFIVPQR